MKIILDFLVGLGAVIAVVFILFGLGYIGDRTLFYKDHDSYFITFSRGILVFSLLVLITWFILALYIIGKNIIELL
jgi:hypothetical protein